MVTPPGQARVLRILWESAALSYSSGFSLPAHSSRCRDRKVAQLAWMMNGRGAAWRTSALGFWDGTCLGPVRGPWPDESWKGWWGEEPPYHVPTFVLTHHPRKPLEMKGGTTFYFVTDGIHSALERAKDAAKEKDVRIGGGVATIQQYLRAKLIDELHLAFRPILMGSGENLFAGIDLATLGYACTEHVSTEHAMHVVLKKTA